MTTTQGTRPSEPTERREWDAGYLYGFGDNHIDHWRLRNHTPSFVLGYKAGKAEIDRLVEEADEARRNYGEHL